MSNAFRTLIIPVSDATSARLMASTLSPAGGVAMWTTGLSPTGAAPATHYISTGVIDGSFADILPTQAYTLGHDEQGQPTGWSLASSAPGSAATVRDLAQAGGMGVTMADVQGLFARADVTEQEPFVAMARLGLQLVTEEV